MKSIPSKYRLYLESLRKKIHDSFPLPKSRINEKINNSNTD